MSLSVTETEATLHKILQKTVAFDSFDKKCCHGPCCCLHSVSEPGPLDEDVRKQPQMFRVDDS